MSHFLVATVSERSTRKSVMFNVIDQFEQSESDKGLRKEEGESLRSKKTRDENCQGGLRGKPLENLVSRTPGFSNAFAFEFQRVNVAMHVRASKKAKTTFAATCASGVVGCCHVHVVSANVLDVEMLVPNRAKKCVCREPRDEASLVRQLVRHRDA